MGLRKALFATTAGLAALAALPAFAQSAPAKDTSVEEVVVTGSRAIRDGSQQPTPVTVVGAEQLQNIAPSNVADGLRQLPIFKGVLSPNNNGLSAQSDTGANLLALRNLGTARTLVLLDGHRMISAGGGDSTDTNIFPQPLVSRVDVVTGGASAAYGSDAVAGVVNFVLNNKFVGLKGSVQGGISTYGDAISQNETLTFGHGFLDDRAHILLSGEYASKNGIGPYNTGGRDWAQKSFGIITNPAYSASDPNHVAGPRQLVYMSGVVGSSATYGGLIQNSPLKNTQFTAGGGTAPFALGTNVTTSTMVGGDGVIDRGDLSANLNRWTTFARLAYDITPTMHAHVDLTYAGSNSQYDQYWSTAYTANSTTVFASNAYLPASVASALTASAASYSAADATTCRQEAAGAFTSAGAVVPIGSGSIAATPNLACFKFGRINTEMMVVARQTKEVYRVLAGVDGELANGWKYELFYNRGTAHADRGYDKPLNFVKLVAAQDALKDTTGAIKCAVLVPDAQRPSNYVGPAYDATIAAKFAGCQPYNPFGVGAPSQAAIDYVGDGNEDIFIHRKQDNAGGSLSGDLPDWTKIGYANPSFATGVEYRRESVLLDVTANAVQTIDYTGLRGGLLARQGLKGPFLVGNFSPHQNAATGEPDVYSTKEFFAELVLPVFKEQTLAHQLDFNAAYRYTDYSVSGGVNTWKIGGVYEPVEGIRFRATKSHDIRGPNSDDLFAGGATGSGTLADPFHPGQTIAFISKTGGNPNLEPEVSDTLTTGIVLNPTFLPGFGISADYYNIKVKNAIGAVPLNTIVAFCQAGQQLYCNQIEQRTGLLLVNATNVNLASEFVQGWDFESSYRFDALGGHGSLRVIANYQPTHKRQAAGATTSIQYAGQAGSDFQGGVNNKFTTTAIFNYDKGPFGLTYQEQYFSSGTLLDSSMINGVDISAADNHVKAWWIGVLNARIKFGEDQKYEGFVSINNVWNRDPPFAPQTTGLRQIYSGPAYDAIGRYYTVGLRFRM